MASSETSWVWAFSRPKKMVAASAEKIGGLLEEDDGVVSQGMGSTHIQNQIENLVASMDFWSLHNYLVVINLAFLFHGRDYNRQEKGCF